MGPVELAAVTYNRGNIDIWYMSQLDTDLHPSTWVTNWDKRQTSLQSICLYVHKGLSHYSPFMCMSEHSQPSVHLFCITYFRPKQHLHQFLLLESFLVPLMQTYHHQRSSGLWDSFDTNSQMLREPIVLLLSTRLNCAHRIRMLCVANATSIYTAITVM